jgi:hypothetical protein
MTGDWGPQPPILDLCQSQIGNLKSKIRIAGRTVKGVAESKANLHYRMIATRMDELNERHALRNLNKDSAIPRDWLADVEGFPVCHIDNIIATKASTNRGKDHETPPGPPLFRE